MHSSAVHVTRRLAQAMDELGLADGEGGRAFGEEEEENELQPLRYVVLEGVQPLRYVVLPLQHTSAVAGAAVETFCAPICFFLKEPGDAQKRPTIERGLLTAGLSKLRGAG